MLVHISDSLRRLQDQPEALLSYKIIQPGLILGVPCMSIRLVWHKCALCKWKKKLFFLSWEMLPFF